MKAVSYLGAALTCMTMGASLTYAVDKTYRFESIQLEHTHRGPTPFLDLGEVNSITYDLITDFTATDSNPFKSVRNLTIDFKNAPDLKIPYLEPLFDSIPTMSISCDGPQFYALVDDVWVYRKIEILFCADTAPGGLESPFSYAIAVKGMEDYMRDTPMGGSFEIAYGTGTTINTTPNKPADRVETTFLEKDITLELLTNPTDIFEPETGNSELGFIVNVSWLGHGDKTLTLPMGNSPDVLSTAITLLIEEFEFSGTPNKELLISVKFIDSTGREMQTSPVDLRQLLETSYGPLN